MRWLGWSVVALLFTACSARPVRCDRDQIPPDLLRVPAENQLCELLQIFDPNSCASAPPAKPSDSN